MIFHREKELAQEYNEDRNLQEIRENLANFMEPKKIDHSQGRLFEKPLSEQLNPTLSVRVHGVKIIELQEEEIFSHDMLRRIQLRTQTGFANFVSK